MKYRLAISLFILCFLPGKSFAQDDLDISPMIGSVDSSDFFIQNDYYLWCSTVIKGEDGRYHMFYSRWPHGKRALDDDSMNYIFDGFRGWNKYSEIAYAVSDKVNGPYKYVKTILKGDGSKNKWDRFTMHNPQVRKFGDYYYLYYISNSYDSTLQFDNPKFTSDWKHWLQYNATQKIGVIKFKSFSDLLKGKFSKPLLPLMKPDSVHTFEVTTNPTVTEGPDGKFYMLFKSRKPNVGNTTFWMAVSDKPDGTFKLASEVFTSSEMACEDPCMWYDKKRKRFYAAVKYYSNSKKLVPQFGALALITSEDGLHWQAANNPLISLRELKMNNGSKI
ncbi:MAG TPA: glycoside hydrolase family protein, partial [Chitinophagaceae bacterium]